VLEYSRLGAGGEGVRALMTLSSDSCWDNGEGAIKRGSIFDIGGVVAGLLLREGC
jgi:hypothetical protein